MNRIERLALHALLFCVFAVACMNVGFIAGAHVARWSLPAAYLLYLAGWALWRRRRGLAWPSFRQVGLCILVPVLLLVVARGIGTMYDTSWDGQDYHQSAILALHDGWNPWRTSVMPVHVPANGQYAVGYPKATWLLQTGIYNLTGRLQSVAVMNVVVGFAAAVLVFGALRRLGVRGTWRWIIMAFAVLEIHFVQQLPTFMADGYSYALALAALAFLLFYAVDSPAQSPVKIADKKSKKPAVSATRASSDTSVLVAHSARNVAPLLGFLAAWILLAGSKFSNLFICGLLMLAMLVLIARNGAWRTVWFRWLVAGFIAVTFVVLWAPYGTNTIRFGSPLYPQNQPGENAKLRFDNVPNNLKHANRAELLFYGIFSHTEGPGAGNALSPQNVAKLKVPFTFYGYEIGEVNNFQGRVGSAGVLFSGIFVVSLLLLVWLVLRAYGARSQLPLEWRLARGAAVLGLLILVAALVIPVSNKLRYSPLVTLIPVVVLALSVRLARPGRAGKIVRATSVFLALCIGVNLVLAVSALARARIHEAHVINQQLTVLHDSGLVYEAHASAFYGSYARLQEHHIPIKIVDKLTCSSPIALQYTYSTTNLCAMPLQY